MSTKYYLRSSNIDTVCEPLVVHDKDLAVSLPASSTTLDLTSATGFFQEIAGFDRKITEAAVGGSGTFNCSLSVTANDTSGKVEVHAVSSGCSTLDQQTAFIFTGTGTKTGSVSVNMAGADRLRIMILVLTGTITINVDHASSWVQAPWTVRDLGFAIF